LKVNIDFISADCAGKLATYQRLAVSRRTSCRTT